MGKLLSLLLLTSLSLVNAYVTYIAARLPLQGNRSSPGSPWPMPRQWSHDPRIFTMDPSRFVVNSNLDKCDVIDKALERYRKILFYDKNITRNGELPQLLSLTVTVRSGKCEKCPRQESDEKYNLSVEAPDVRISAMTIWGALRGLETFSQLVYTEEKSDAMEYNKLNVFHWHIVDDQSFPYVSTTFPELSEKAAYSPRHVYTQEDVHHVIEYARLRGIRIVPEFDTPGHTQSWGKAFPELLTPCWVDGQPYQDKYGLQGHAASENFNPTQNRTYEFMADFLKEIVEVFEDEYIDLGMDEAHYYCWQSSPNISRFMKDKGFGPDEFYKLEQYYENRLLSIARELGAKVYIYQDPIDHGAQVHNSTIVRIWKGESKWQAYAQNVTNLGYNVIITACYYLNYISYGQDWRNYYACDPQSFQGTGAQKERVLGGEASLWAEYVDATNILSRLWPRASAVAERLWSSADINDADSAAFRLDEHRCRMVRRGIPAQPVLPGHCNDLDLDPDLFKSDVRTPCDTSASRMSFPTWRLWLLTLLFTIFL